MFRGPGLPIHAPPVLRDVMGIIGIYGDYKVVEYVTAHWDEILAAVTGAV